LLELGLVALADELELGAERPRGEPLQPLVGVVAALGLALPALEGSPRRDHPDPAAQRPKSSILRDLRLLAANGDEQLLAEDLRHLVGERRARVDAGQRRAQVAQAVRRELLGRAGQPPRAG